MSTDLAERVTDRLARVRARIEAAGRRAEEVTVVAVTKGFGAEAVAAVAGAGLFDVGESYARELVAKATSAPAGPPALRWHFLGPVQRNKVARLAPHVHLWQAVDRLVAGAEVARRAPGASVLVQVDLAGLPGRPGCAWDAAPALVEGLDDLGLDVRGLMGVAGFDGARTQFRRLARLAAGLGLHELSMGMSSDFETAVQEGSTMIRVGTALLDARPGPVQVRR